MNLHDYVSQLIIDTKGLSAGGWFGMPTAHSSLGVFLPELVLCAAILLLLLLRLSRWGRRVDPSWTALAASFAALLLATPWVVFHWPLDGRMEIFTGMLVYDGFTVFMRSVLLLFAVLFVTLTKLSGLLDREDAADIYTLFFGATLGMCLMASANHLLMVFMAIEMASVPSYVLAGLLKGQRLGGEAALKYSVYGAGAAAVMLYGISLIAGVLHTAHLPTLTIQLAQQLPHLPSESVAVLGLGGLMMMVGLAFKISAVPFHFWCPDVFEGACAEVDAFLSVASKAAALALLVRVAIGFSALAPPGAAAGEDSQAAAGAFAVADSPSEPQAQGGQPSRQQASEKASLSDGLQRSRDFGGRLVAFLAILTCTFGNLAAYGQTNMKRLLAYSTIAHAGYMMMAIPPLMAMAGEAPEGGQKAVAALAIYLFVYLFMNLGAFAIVAFLRNEIGSEEIAAYSGLIRRCPGVVLCLALILFSLVGLPPLSGFVGKFAVFAALADGYRETSQFYLIVLLVAGALNTAISLFYYLRVVRVMTMAPEAETGPPLALAPAPFLFVLLITLPTAGLILVWDSLNQWALAAASRLLT